MGSHLHDILARIQPRENRRHAGTWYKGYVVRLKYMSRGVELPIGIQCTPKELGCVRVIYDLCLSSLMIPIDDSHGHRTDLISHLVRVPFQPCILSPNTFLKSLYIAHTLSYDCSEYTITVSAALIRTPTDLSCCAGL